MRYAFRKWFAHPLIALLAIATIALAIGVCTAVFSIISASDSPMARECFSHAFVPVLR